MMQARHAPTRETHRLGVAAEAVEDAAVERIPHGDLGAPVALEQWHVRAVWVWPQLGRRRLSDLHAAANSSNDDDDDDDNNNSNTTAATTTTMTATTTVATTSTTTTTAEATATTITRVWCSRGEKTRGEHRRVSVMEPSGDRVCA